MRESEVHMFLGLVVGRQLQAMSGTLIFVLQGFNRIFLLKETNP